ncbi:MAG: DUF3014 domain-containing protein [Methylobacter tundripaludum]|nr:DUF3014 domain-containing protein [Methylobacter tundripaludum]
MNRYDQSQGKKIGRAVIVATIILAALASAGWFYFKHQQSAAVTEPESRTLAFPSGFGQMGAMSPLSVKESIEGMTAEEAVSDNIVELQQETAFILPDLDHSDALFREEMTGISPALAGRLNTDQLVRKYVVIVNDFSQGLRLEKHLRFLQPDQPFAVEQQDGSLFISTKSYQRYDWLAAAINELDVQATLAVYKKFRPLLLQVFREFSYPDEYSLEDIFTKAASVILAAPVVDGRLAVLRHSINYKFADRQLEAANPVHKQMLRMGPENTRIIQNKLRILVEGLVNTKE